MVNHDPIMEAIQKTATKTASCLSKTVAAETVDFIVNTSLQILPLTHREGRTNEGRLYYNGLGAQREEQFTILMDYIARNFAQGNRNAFDGGQRTIMVVLKKIDEALVTKFTQLMQVWERHSLLSRGQTALVDKQASPSENLKSSFTFGNTEPAKVDATQSSPDSATAVKIPKQNPAPSPQAAKKMADDLADAFSVACIKSIPPARPFDTTVPFEKQHDQLPDLCSPQQPCEANSFGVETRDGMLIGHPPAYPPGLLDWESPEDDEEMEELVCNRRARAVAQEPASRRGGGPDSRTNSCNSSEDHKMDDSDDDWVCL